jgi:hypothetical protein
MGKSVTRLTKSESQIKNEIYELNKLTKTKIFEKRTGILINFSYSQRKKHIRVHFVKNRNNFSTNLSTHTTPRKIVSKKPAST